MHRVFRWMTLLAVAASGCGKAPESKPSADAKKEPPKQVAQADAPKKDESAPKVDAPSAEHPKQSGKPEVVAVEAIYALPADDGSGKKLTIAEIEKYLSDPKNHQTILPAVPVGLGPIDGAIPADNPITRAKAELGRLLYFDGRLSRDSTISCASCHSPAEGWADADQFSFGINGQKGGRQSPTVMNRAFGKLEFWDGRANSLEDQALGPIQNPVEMGFTLKEVVDRINGIEGYKLFFKKVFGGECTPENLAKAIATFERTVLTGANPNDYHTLAEPFRKLSEEELDDLPDDQKARAKKILADAKAHPLSEPALRGRTLYFGKAECSVCHVGANLTDEAFYNIGVGAANKEPDEGRAKVSKKPEDTGAFKTPTLRNIALTAPYMHDGTQKSLLEVVDHYDKGGTPNPHQSNRIKKLNLTKQEKEDLVQFMKEGLAGPLPNLKAPRLP